MQRHAFVAARPNLSLIELVEEMKREGLYSSATPVSQLSHSIAWIRRRIELGLQEVMKEPTFDQERLQYIAQWTPRPSDKIDPVEVKKTKRAAFRGISAFLASLGWKKTHPAKGTNPAFWRDPEGTGIHRADFAFTIEIGRSVPLEKRAPAKRDRAGGSWLRGDA